MLKYLLPLVLFVPFAATPARSQYNNVCVRTKSTTVQGYYDQYGRWWGPQTIQEDVAEPCYVTGYVPPVGRPAPYWGNTRYIGPGYIPMCGKSTLDILGIPIIGSTNVCQ
jgi:hypothetical protein